ncbi:MAG: TldD/PmbA family protein [Candidatus Fimadaptatus sp.]|jgi:PmbA protein
MELNEYISKVFAAAKAAGFEACECCYTTGEDMSISVFGGEIDEYSLSNSITLRLRGLYNGHMGYAATRVLDEASIDWLVESAKSSAELIDNDDKEFLFAGSESYAEVNSYSQSIADMTAREKIDAALDMEKQTLERDERIKRVVDCSVISSSSEVRMVNTLGLDVSFRDNALGAFVVPMAEQDGDMSNAFSIKFVHDKDELDTSAIVREGVSEALAMFGAKPCKSGAYTVLLRHDVMADMLSTFEDMFSADEAQHGLSLLKDREGDKIASDIVTIIDDPLMKNGMASQPFDSEGVATYTKAVVENGVLNTLLHNLKTAYKQGVKTTGNAARAGGSIGVSPSNFFIKPGERSLDELIGEVGEGIMITDLMGMHAGANPVSGDFSLGARGFMIEGGKLGRPVKGITVAGNFFKLLNDVRALGSDLWFGMPGMSCCGAPSAIIASLSVAGE